MNLKEVNLYNVYKRWTSKSNNFIPYFKLTIFESLQRIDDVDLNTITKCDNIYNLDYIRNIIKDSNDTLYIFDTDGDKGIELAAILQNIFKIKSVLDFGMNFHDRGIVGNKNYIKSLIESSDNLINNKDFDKYALILDINRYKNDIDYDIKKTFNNQYELSEEDVPDIEFLNKNNINKIIFFYDLNIKEDISSYLNYLSENNIIVEQYKLERK